MSDGSLASNLENSSGLVKIPVIKTSTGAHDADRTRDLVLTKDVLYQLSYVGTPSRRDNVNRESLIVKRERLTDTCSSCR